MKSDHIQRTLLTAALVLLAFAVAPAAQAQPWVSFDDNTRYLALGDSLSAGFEAKPVTQGFVYQLYHNGVIDRMNNLLFCTAAVPGATSNDVLSYQIPQVRLFFSETGKAYRKVVTLTVGGNDLFSLLGPGGSIDPTLIPGVLLTYRNNLAGILASLSSTFPGVEVYVGNLYDPKLPVPGADQLVAALNQIAAGVAGQFPGVVLVDLFAAFQGRNGLLLIEKRGAGFNVHPTSAGHQVMTEAFSHAIASH